MSNEEFLLALDPNGVEALNTAELRAAVVAADLYGRRIDVATLPVNAPEVVGKAGTLTLIDKVVQGLIAAYGDREAEVTLNYNGVQVTVWAEDSALRSSLRYAAERAHEAAGSFNNA